MASASTGGTLSAPALDEQRLEGAAHIVLRLARHVLVRKASRRDAQDVQAVAPALLGEIERRQLAQGLHFQHVAAPAEAQALERLDRGILGHHAQAQRRLGAVVEALRRGARVAALLDGIEQDGGLMAAILGGEQAGRAPRSRRFAACGRSTPAGARSRRRRLRDDLGRARPAPWRCADVPATRADISLSTGSARSRSVRAAFQSSSAASIRPRHKAAWRSESKAAPARSLWASR